MTEPSEDTKWGTVQPEAWKAHAVGGPEPLPDAVVENAAKQRISAQALHHEVEAVHGLEAHDTGYADAVESIAAMVADAKRESSDAAEPMRVLPGDLALLHAAGIEGTHATTQLDVLRKHDVWTADAVGQYAMPAVAVLTKARETEQTRTRILAVSATEPWEYDLVVALGYTTERQFFHLPVHPISWNEQRRKVEVVEVIADPDDVTPPTGSVFSVLMSSGDLPRRIVHHDLPVGWSLVEEHRLPNATPNVHFVSPAEQASLVERGTRGQD